MTKGRLIIAVILAVILVPFASYHFIPDRELQGVAERYLASAGYSFKAAAFGKTFLPGISAKGVTISDARGPLVKLDSLSCRIAMMPLLAGKALLEVDGALGAGTVAGSLEMGKKPSGTVAAKGIRLEDIPFFLTATGAQVKGLLRIDGSFSGAGKNLSGELRAEVRGAEIADVKIGALALPSATYDRIQGMFRSKEGQGRLEGLTLQGEGLYTRLSGDLTFTQPIGHTPLNLVLEIMPKPEFLEKQKLVFLLMAKYLDSPGHYRIPVGGVLAKPSVE